MLYSPKQWDKPYKALLLIHKETKCTWLIACCYNGEYQGDTVYYGVELKEKWGVIADTIESLARSGDKISASDLERFFEHTANDPAA